MSFLKKLGRNLLFLIILGIVLLVLFPTQMSQVFALYGAIFGPLAILLLIAAALPKKA